jgi:hypothetical protein
MKHKSNEFQIYQKSIEFRRHDIKIITKGLENWKIQCKFNIKGKTEK